MLWRLNHVLLPEPGSPIDNTTAPLDLGLPRRWSRDGGGKRLVRFSRFQRLGGFGGFAVGPPGDGKAGVAPGVADESRVRGGHDAEAVTR